MNSRELIRYSLLHERRASTGTLLTSFRVALLVGAAIAGWVAWRGEHGPLSASRAWLVCTVVAFMVAFVRVPFHVYWRPDAALLAQLPIAGRPLFDAALLRCARAAALTLLAVVVGLAPLARSDVELAARHLAFAGTFAAVTAFLIPAVVVWTASWVAHGITGELLRVTGAVDVKQAAMASAAARSSASAILGAVPGALGSFVIVFLLLVSPWLTFEAPKLPVVPTLGGLAMLSLVAIAATRAGPGHAMGDILRDVSALDRQRLATLEIRPPTALERAIGKLVGPAGALAYDKDARLVRRRYPMAFALGGLAFAVLVIVGIARPSDPAPWLTVTLAGGAAYAVALAGRLARPPIELPRLSSTLPIDAAARARAKLAWLLGWWLIYFALPGAFASLRQTDPLVGLALVGGGTLVALVAGRLRR